MNIFFLFYFLPIPYLKFIYFDFAIVYTLDICKHLRPLYKMRHCFRCQGNTEFYCRECSIDLCSMCKEKHCIDLDSKDHEHVIYRNKVIYPSEQTACKNHPDSVYEMFCKLCAIPICALCVEHAQHENINILTALELIKKTTQQNN